MPIYRLFLFITFTYAVWAGLFIYNSSFIIDGIRYYCLFDDGMISMRYAENWVNGKGIVWSQGEYVEGYTNPLQVVLMAGCLLVAPKIQAVLLVQLLGIVMVVACSWFAGKIFENIQGSPQGIWIIWIAIYLLYPLSYWSLLGMETGLVSALLAISIYLLTNPTRTLNLWLVGGVLFLLYLTRPDTVIYILVIFGYLLFNTTSKKELGSIAVKLVLPVLILISTHILWRYYYYGEFKPNTATLKLDGWELADKLGNGLAYIQPLISNLYPLILLSLISIFYQYGKKVILIVTIVGVVLIYNVYIGGDAFVYWRLATPSIILLIALSTCGSLFLFKRVVPPPKLNTSVCSLVLMLLASYWFNQANIKQQLLLSPASHCEGQKRKTEIGLILKEITSPDAVVGVSGAGALPFYAERKAIDFLGKCDKKIAQSPRKPRINPRNKMEGRKPEFFMEYWPGHDKFDLEYSIGTLSPDYVEHLNISYERSKPKIANKYKKIKLRGEELILLKGSQNIYWEKIKTISP